MINIRLLDSNCVDSLVESITLPVGSAVQVAVVRSDLERNVADTEVPGPAGSVLPLGMCSAVRSRGELTVGAVR